MWHATHQQSISTQLEELAKETKPPTCRVPPPAVLSQSSDTLTMVHGSSVFQLKSTTLSLHPYLKQKKRKSIRTCNHWKYTTKVTS